MEESLLLKIALSFSLLGLVVLFFLTNNLKIEETKIENLTDVREDSIVRVRGVITDIRDYGKMANLEIAQPQRLDIIIFKSSNLSLQKGSFVDIVGEVREYNGRKELIASQIDVLE